MKPWTRWLVAAGMGLCMPYLGRPEVDTLLVRLVFDRRFWDTSGADAAGLGFLYGLFVISWLAGTAVAYGILVALGKLRGARWP